MLAVTLNNLVVMQIEGRSFNGNANCFLPLLTDRVHITSTTLPCHVLAAKLLCTLQLNHIVLFELITLKLIMK